MDALLLLSVLWIDGVGWGQAPYGVLGSRQLERVQRRLSGQVLDFTHNHGADRRLWSPALGQKRDLYVYLPPGFDPHRQYPLAIYLHGAAQDEHFFLQVLVRHLDEAMVQGHLPPMIVAMPDGSWRGRASMLKPAMFFTNSRMGRFEDYVMQDVWDFLHASFPIRPEREAHMLMGGSMGGSSAFTLGIKHKDRVKLVMGVYPLLNVRWTDSHGHYRAAFDPDDWGWRERMRGWESMGRRGIFTARFHLIFGPAMGHGRSAVAKMQTINPIEMIDAYDIRPGDLDMFVAYGGKDEFNVAAQVESFLWRARERGLDVGVAYDPRGKHDVSTGLRLLPEALRWATAHLPPATP